MVISMRTSFKALKGNRMNWFCGINNPNTADIKGILKVRIATGIFWGSIIPSTSWHWGTVGDIKGYLAPLAKLGE